MDSNIAVAIISILVIFVLIYFLIKTQKDVAVLQEQSEENEENKSAEQGNSEESSPPSLEEVILRQAQDIRMLRNCVLFFVVLTIIGMIFVFVGFSELMENISIY